MLQALANIMDPDLGQDIVACGFVKDLAISTGGKVAFRLQLTTPACPIKEEFRKQVSNELDFSLSPCTMSTAPLLFTIKCWKSKTMCRVPQACQQLSEDIS